MVDPEDLRAMIADLRARLKLVKSAIVELELRQVGPASNRGRKSMGPEEREAVARRMTEYWAKRRKEKRHAS